MKDQVYGNTRVAPADLMSIPVGSIILVGKPLDETKQDNESSVWFVYSEGKAEIINSHYHHSETEDLDWFTRWEVTIVGFNKEYAELYTYQNLKPVEKVTPVTMSDLLGAGAGKETPTENSLFQEFDAEARRNRRRRLVTRQELDENRLYK